MIKKIIAIFITLISLFTCTACFTKDYSLVNTQIQFDAFVKSATAQNLMVESGCFKIQYNATLQMAINNSSNADFNVLNYNSDFVNNIKSLSECEEYFSLLTMANVFFQTRKADLISFSEPVPQQELNDLYGLEQQVESALNNLNKYKVSLENMCVSVDVVVSDFNVNKALVRYKVAYKGLIKAILMFNLKFANIYIKYLLPLNEPTVFLDYDINTVLSYQMLMSSFALFQQYLNKTNETTVQFCDTTLATQAKRLYSYLCDYNVEQWKTNNNEAGAMSDSNHNNLVVYYTTLKNRMQNYENMVNNLDLCANILRDTASGTDIYNEYTKQFNNMYADVLTNSNICDKIVDIYK